MPYIRFNPMKIKIMKRIYLLEVTPTVITKNIVHLGLDLKNRIFYPRMTLFYCEHLFIDEKGKYQKVNDDYRKPILVTKEELDTMTEIGDSIYLYKATETDEVLPITELDFLEYLNRMQGNISLGDCLVFSPNGNIVVIKEEHLSSLYILDEKS